jgi:hypothetical protein
MNGGKFMEHKAKVRVKDSFGTRRFYPECQVSQIFADIAGTTTLTDLVLKDMAKLGYQIDYTHDGELPTANAKEQ